MIFLRPLWPFDHVLNIMLFFLCFMPICFDLWYWKKLWYDMIWYDMIWYDMIWYDMIWYDMIYMMIMCTQLKNILPTDSFLSNAEYEVSSFFFFFFLLLLFFITFHKIKNRKITIFSSTGMQNSTIIKEMRYVSIVCLRLTVYLSFFLIVTYVFI